MHVDVYRAYVSDACGALKCADNLHISGPHKRTHVVMTARFQCCLATLLSRTQAW
jgi:hypothetical protein